MRVLACVSLRACVGVCVRVLACIGMVCMGCWTGISLRGLASHVADSHKDRPIKENKK